MTQTHLGEGSARLGGVSRMRGAIFQALVLQRYLIHVRDKYWLHRYGVRIEGKT